MKLLDEKGRLFGKINLIDFIVAVVLIAAVAAVAWKLIGSKIAEAMAPEPPVYEYEVLCSGVYPEVADFAETCVGDRLLTNDGLLDGEVVAVRQEAHVPTLLDVSENDLSKDAPELRDLYVTMRCLVTPRKLAYAVGNQELRVGKTHIVKSTKLEIAGGIILSMKEVGADE